MDRPTRPRGRQVRWALETSFRVNAPVYARPMGSSGMKRKGRRHLPKVGTRPAMEDELQDHRERALHPFAADPSRRHLTPGSTLIALAIAVIVAIGVIALVFTT